jgi:hypothetical protein
MMANAVVPNWLRSVLVKYQLGDLKAGFDILKRVENKSPLSARSAGRLRRLSLALPTRQKLLLILDRARLKCVDLE